MKTTHILIFLAGTLCCAAQSGGPWSIRAFTIDNGGQSSTGGTWTLTGTIGQADASEMPARGGSFAVAGGFWPEGFTAPGDPMLTIAMGILTGVPDSVRLEWPASAAGHQLQYTDDLTTWTDYGKPVTGADHAYFGMNNGSRYYFRLKKL